MIVVVFITAVYLIQLLLGAILVLAYFKSNDTSLSPKISEVSVIISFKNEAKRIPGLLQQLPKLIIPTGLNVEFIFVNDHSSDGSERIVEDYLPKNAVLIKSNDHGKKQAIKTGVSQAKYEFMLTWDADTNPRTNYFVKLSGLAEADMWILPVKLGGKNIVQRLGAVEFSWLQVLGIGLAKMLSPQLCNGANLLFRKSLFEKVDAKRTDYHIASGDDMFLLNEFKQLDADIQASSHGDLMVEAESPGTFNSLLKQRQRWAGKMSSLKSGFSILFGVLLIVFVFIGFVLTSMVDLGWVILIPVVMKVTNEYVLLQIENRGGNWLSNFLLVIVHQLWYPIYLIRLLFPVKGKEKRWA